MLFVDEFCGILVYIKFGADVTSQYDNDVQKGVEIACRQNEYWEKEIVPHRYMEHAVLGNAVFAAWVAVTCEEKRISEAAAKKLSENLAFVDWDNLHLSYAFAAESALLFKAH